MALYGIIGNGKVAHELVTPNEPATLDGKTATKFVENPGAEGYTMCKNCKTISDNLSDDLTQGNGSATMASSIKTDEGDTMPPTTRKTAAKPAKPADDAKPSVEEITQDVENALATMAETNNVETAEALFKQIETSVKLLTANKRAPLIMRAKEARAAATERAKAPAAPAIVETKNWRDAEGAEELFNQGAEKVKGGVGLGLKASKLAEEVAHTVLFARLKMTNKKGLPDFKATSQAAKDFAAEMYAKALEGLDPEDIETKEAHKSLQRGVQNRMPDVTVTYLRALNNSPEEFAKTFPMITPVAGEAPEEAVRSVYEAAGLKLPEHTRAEQAALDKKRTLELTAKVESGEATPEEVAEVTGEVAPEVALTSSLGKVAKSLKGLEGVTSEAIAALDDETKTAVRKELDAGLEALKKLIANLL